MSLTSSVAAVLPAQRSLAGWAALAVFMVLFSYAFTLLLAGACVYLPYLLLTRTSFNILQSFVVFLCGLIMAATMLWSLVPRLDKFTAPGPQLTSSDQPRLFAEIERLASALGEPMPAAVYLVPDVNAWVARRGGLMGFGSRRVMGLGLPLLQILGISEFRAVLAHEFGHYYCGDTRLGPWVYAARDTMVRTLANIGTESELMDAITRVALARAAHHLVVIALEAYWKLFMRATQLVSRRQEYRADELACALAGSSALISGLRLIEGSSVALSLFWRSEIAPALEVGCRLPIAEGFARFVALPKIAAAISKHVETELNATGTFPYDSHPPLRNRLVAAASFPGQPQPESNAPAVTLFDDVDRLEVKLLEMMAPQLELASLKLVAWERIGPEVYLPSWRTFVAECGRALVGIKVEEVPEMGEDPKALIAQMRDPKGTLLTREQRADRARALLWTAFALTLLDNGWELHAEPGEYYLQLGEHILKPDELAMAIRSGTMTKRDWASRAQTLGIGHLYLIRDSAE